ncbi:MAG: hypothetical protein FWE98_05995 [Oscillospiraceae bacterium]|nr:hypothetical protein [Oscillospiraceae bacterium]
MGTPCPNIYALDCTALMLPYAASKTMPPVYRVAAALTEEIDADILGQAVRDLVPRFPALYVKLRKGFFWDRLEHTPGRGIAMEDGEPCRPFQYKDREEPLLRVLYHGNELAVECSHFSADATAAMAYLNSLAARYLELRGYAIEKSRIVLDCRDEPTEAELADGYRAVYEKPKDKKVPLEGMAYKYLARRRDGRRQITQVQMPIDATKRLLKEKYGGCTVSEYLIAVYACAFLQLYKIIPKQRRPIRFSIPIDLRHFWPMDTLRNFAAAASVTLLPAQADCGFQDILEHVRREMRENVTQEKMRAFISQTVSYLDMLGAVPGFVKRLAVRAGSPLLGKAVWPYTSSISNLGYIRLPPSLAEHVQSCTFALGGFDLPRIVCAAVGVNNVMTVTFSSVDECAVRDFCIAFWERDGLPVRVTVRDF